MKDSRHIYTKNYSSCPTWRTGVPGGRPASFQLVLSICAIVRAKPKPATQLPLLQPRQGGATRPGKTDTPVGNRHPRLAKGSAHGWKPHPVGSLDPSTRPVFSHPATALPTLHLVTGCHGPRGGTARLRNCCQLLEGPSVHHVRHAQHTDVGPAAPLQQVAASLAIGGESGSQPSRGNDGEVFGTQVELELVTRWCCGGHSRPPSRFRVLLHGCRLRGTMTVLVMLLSFLVAGEDPGARGARSGRL